MRVEKKGVQNAHFINNQYYEQIAMYVHRQVQQNLHINLMLQQTKEESHQKCQFPIPGPVSSEKQNLTKEEKKEGSKEREQEERRVMMIQKNIRGCLGRVMVKRKLKMLTRRRRIIEELIESQQNYIRDLGFIVSDFNMKLLSNGILDQNQSRVIFSNVQQIRKLHQDFFTTLYNSFACYHHYQVLFADILKIILFFRIYIEYLNNFPTACQLIESLEKTNEDFAQFLIEISRSKKYRFLRIQDYLIKPVQRLPKYVLLLKEIKKNTETEHPDYINICKALEKFQEVNTNNNEKLLRLANNYKLLEIGQALKLPDGIITPTVQFILEEAVQIYVPEYNSVLPNCMMYLLNNCVIVSKKLRNFGFRDTMKKAKSNAFNEKLELIVPLKHGTGFIKSQDQDIYKYSVTLQAPDGQSCTFVCSCEDELYVLQSRLKKQIDRVESETVSKLQNMLKAQNLHSKINNDSFLMNLTLVDLIPHVTILGTAQRNDKMLKYTVYIIQIKVKMIRQKIFLRFSQLLKIQACLLQLYPNLVMKQTLVNKSWLKNHQQKTIEERKINIERFLKQLLSKPQIISDGSKILIKLGLPADLYQLPKKVMSTKSSEDFIKKSSLIGMSQLQMKKKQLRGNNGSCEFPSFLKNIKKSSQKNSKIQKKSQFLRSSRMSIFEQQKLEEEEEDSILEKEEHDYHKVADDIIEQSSQSQNEQSKQSPTKVHNKSSYIKRNCETLTIQDILKANEIDLGHYTRCSQLLQQAYKMRDPNSESESLFKKMNRTASEIFNRNQSVDREVNSLTEIKIHVMAIEYNFTCRNTLYSQVKNKSVIESTDKSQTENKRQAINYRERGYRSITLKTSKYQRIQSIIPLVAKSLKLRCYKDFRLFLQKEFSSRVLDDDELVYKVIEEIECNGSVLVFKKMIYLDHQTEEKELKNDRIRLSLVAAQIISEVKKGKYLLSYEDYLKFAVLAAIIYGEYHGRVESLAKLERHSLMEEPMKSNATFIKYLSVGNISEIAPKQNQVYELHNDMKYLRALARESVQVIFPKYSSFSHKVNIWIQDFIRSYRIILSKLFHIRDMNSTYKQDVQSLVVAELSTKSFLNSKIMISQKNLNIHQQSKTDSFVSEGDYEHYERATAEESLLKKQGSKKKTEISVKYLAMMGIFKQIQSSENDLFGGLSFSVQISEELKEVLCQSQAFTHNRGSQNNMYDRISYRNRLNAPEKNWRALLKQEEDNRNCWLLVRYNKLMLISINLRLIFFQIPYRLLKKINTYSTSIILQLKKHYKQSQIIDEIKLKTTASYYIRDLITYYKNYSEVKKKLQRNEDLQESIIELTREEIVEAGMGEIEEVIL